MSDVTYKHYHEVIDLLGDDGLGEEDAYRIAIGLAKSDPETFIELYKDSGDDNSIINNDVPVPLELFGDNQPHDANAVINKLFSGSVIHAIKEYREQTGVGLKEGKDVIDGIRDFLREHGDAEHIPF